ncbi:MAG: four helix bundle protein [Deltaproteobacteria bacterium]|nr:four helix bundle protein [Deltaproteobacteria bacterium]
MLQNYTCHGVADKRSRKELKVWKKSYKLCLDIYRITERFPKEERYGLISQVRRSALSIAMIKSLESKHLNP